jgi:hypothetical protein
MKDSNYKNEAGLARWLFNKSYGAIFSKDKKQKSSNVMTQYHFYSLILYDLCASPITPYKAGISKTSVYDKKTAFVIDNWNNPNMILAVHNEQTQNSEIDNKNNSHNSFYLSYLREEFFTDSERHCHSHIFKKSTEAACKHDTWSFIFENDDPKKELSQSHEMRESPESDTSLTEEVHISQADNISLIWHDAAKEFGDPIRKAKRMWIVINPDILIITDRIVSRIPLKLSSHFFLNNRDNNMDVHVSTETKLVFRRNPASMKFFQVKSTSEGHDNRCSLMIDPETKHSSIVYKYTSSQYSKEHTYVYIAAMEHIDMIKHRHIKEEQKNIFYIEPTEKNMRNGGVTVDFTNCDLIKIRYHNSNAQYTICANKLKKI